MLKSYLFLNIIFIQCGKIGTIRTLPIEIELILAELFFFYLQVKLFRLASIQFDTYQLVSFSLHYAILFSCKFILCGACAPSMHHSV